MSIQSAITDLIEQLRNGADVVSSVEEVAAEYDIKPVFLMNRAALAHGDLNVIFKNWTTSQEFIAKSPETVAKAEITATKGPVKIGSWIAHPARKYCLRVENIKQGSVHVVSNRGAKYRISAAEAAKYLVG